MTDRFADGDANNNNLYGDEFLPNPEDKYSTDFNKTGPLSYYHGGDFQGIIDNLDYIQDLGFYRHMDYTRGQTARGPAHLRS
jgi:glycosidase